MADTGVYPDSGNSGAAFTTATELANFIPELWSDEIIASYKANLVMAPLVVNMNHTGKKGDTVHIPTPARQSSNVKAPRTAVTIISNDEGEKTWQIRKHYEYSRLIEDFAKVQAIDTYRQFYTDDAGYALALDIDNWLHTQAAYFQNASAYQVGRDSQTAYANAVIGSNGSTLWDPSANTNAGNAAALTDAGLRRMIQTLDDDDVPSARRVLVVPPVEKNNLLATDGDFVKFNRYDGTGSSGASQPRTGLIGDMYSIPTYVSTRAPSVAATDASTDQKAVLLFQKEALVLIDQMKPRTQTQYKQEYLADLFTADHLFDVGLLRPEGGVAAIVTA